VEPAEAAVKGAFCFVGEKKKRVKRVRVVCF
jgi:hypothetical protein